MTGQYGAQAAKAAADAMRDKLKIEAPALAMILGSGLGQVAASLESPRKLSYSDIPGFPRVSVVGHAGEATAGSLEGRDVLVFSGRSHMYEGNTADMVAFPVRVLHALGARVLFLSNAAGGIRRSYRPGDLMIIEDHINLMSQNPLTGPLQEGDDRFPDMSEAYDALLRKLMRDAGPELSVAIHEGVYCGLSGPSYETRAEIRMLERLGADAVGMSTVPEVIVARALGMRVAAVSCIANVASGLSSLPVSHTEVLDTTGRVSDQFVKLIRALVRAL
ncbi:MAG TPA: purine-nucleoside phosphorylase [Gemmatimonadaceae bacterium]|nr:purine-nucleoside phosphorylase [Gemmatimonadaceae bacterium]